MFLLVLESTPQSADPWLPCSVPVPFFLVHYFTFALCRLSSDTLRSTDLTPFTAHPATSLHHQGRSKIGGCPRRWWPNTRRLQRSSSFFAFALLWLAASKGLTGDGFWHAFLALGARSIFDPSSCRAVALSSDLLRRTMHLPTNNAALCAGRQKVVC